MGYWITTWAQAHCGLDVFACCIGGRTIKADVPIALEGKAVRLRFSAPYEKQPVFIKAVSIQKEGFCRKVLFEEGEQLKLQPGETAVSRPLEMIINKDSRLTILIAFGEDAMPVSGNALLPAQYSVPGNYTSAEKFPVSEEDICKNPNRPFNSSVPVFNLCGVDLLSEVPASAAAVLGNSNTFSGVWTKPLEDRIKCPVLNLGISGNRLLGDTGQAKLMNLFGYSALKRFSWDVLLLSGIRTLVIAVGGNDIFQPGTSLGPALAELPSIEELKGGFIELARMAGDWQVTTVCATLTPAIGADKFDQEKEEIRCAINNWIRNGGVFDYVLDMAGFVEESGALRPEFDSGDHLHLNNTAGRHIADAVDINIFEGRNKKC